MLVKYNYGRGIVNLVQVPSEFEKYQLNNDARRVVAKLTDSRFPEIFTTEPRKNIHSDVRGLAAIR